LSTEGSHGTRGFWLEVSDGVSGAANSVRVAARSLARRLEHVRFLPALWLIAAIGLGLRLAWRLGHGTANYWAEGYGFYFDLARNVAQGRGYELAAGQLTAFRVPGYPLFLLAVTGGAWHPWAIVIAQALVGGLTIVATGLIARDLFGRGAGLIAAGTCALYPYYLWHDTALQETALVTCLAAWATWVLLRLMASGAPRLALLAGALLAAAVLTRETMLPFAVVAALWAGWRVANLKGRMRGVLTGASLLAMLAAGLSPWLIHTHREYGEYVLGNEFGAALYAGSDPRLFSTYPDGSVDDSRDIIFGALPIADKAALSSVQPLQRDHWLRDRAVARIAADPVGFAGRFVRKVWIAFRPLPSPLHSAAANLAYAAVWVPLLLLGLAGTWQDRKRWRRDLLFYTQFAAFAGISGVLWAQTAHRVFLDPYLMVFAAGLVSGWLGIRSLQQPGELCQGSGHDEGS
jgi:4-amino-4-deoxy-L-arabinose transferase-like glycosyltransferase